MKISVRNAVSEDLKSINELLRLSKAHWGYDDAFLDRFMEKLSVTEKHIVKYTVKSFYIDDQFAGFFNFIFNTEGVLELDNFFLHPHYIGKGLGRILWDACCQEAESLGKQEFIIWSDPNAEKFYLKMGCEKIGVRQSPVMPDRYPPILKFKLPTKEKNKRSERPSR